MPAQDNKKQIKAIIQRQFCAIQLTTNKHHCFPYFSPANHNQERQRGTLHTQKALLNSLRSYLIKQLDSFVNQEGIFDVKSFSNLSARWLDGDSMFRKLSDKTSHYTRREILNIHTNFGSSISLFRIGTPLAMRALKHTFSNIKNDIKHTLANTHSQSAVPGNANTKPIRK